MISFSELTKPMVNSPAPSEKTIIRFMKLLRVEPRRSIRWAIAKDRLSFSKRVLHSKFSNRTWALQEEHRSIMTQSKWHFCPNRIRNCWKGWYLHYLFMIKRGADNRNFQVRLRPDVAFCSRWINSFVARPWLYRITYRRAIQRRTGDTATAGGG